LVALPGFAVAVVPTETNPHGPHIHASTSDVAYTELAALAGAKRTELWHAALLVLFVLLLAEGALLFRRKRTQSAA
ncbi:MAG: hypothetical protein KC549_18490, partial [Myxococcales bacterium]|nr:hypothetical protein [Myxococcales bacterium]